MPAERVAIVTGVAGAIGGRAAARLAAAGFAVVGTDLAPRGPAAAGLTAYFPADVADPAGPRSVVAAAVAELGRLDAVAAVAGIASRASLSETAPEELERVLAVNVKGCFHTFQAAYDQMVEAGRGGRIVAVSSLAASVGGVFAGPAYSASKAAVEGLVRAVAKAGAGEGILVNAVAPGVTESKMSEDFGWEHSQFPLGRAGRPEDVAGAIAFLCSDDASYVSGATIHVNGGAYFG